MQHDLKKCTLFEVSWEVCNKVGGIYTVVSTKAMQAATAFADNYYLLGPDLGNNPEFDEAADEACWHDLRPAIQETGIPCRFGRWNIPGRPKVILVSFRDHFNQSQLLHMFWSRFGVDSISGGWDYVEPVMFSAACGEIIAAASKVRGLSEHGPVLAHFHEWMCGGGLLYVKQNAPQVGTIFTTHATMLGRAMSGVGYDIYKQMKQINPKREAEGHNIIAKHSMESTSAREADSFTTVSNITADEATAFLGRTPDVVTANGIDDHPEFGADRMAVKRARQKVLDAAGRLLRRRLPEDTRIFLISGRYEYHNKGIDLFLDALAQANQSLAQSNASVLALFSVMGGHNGPNPDAVGGDPHKHPTIGQNWIASHYLHNQPQDPILNACLRLGLNNGPDDKVQVIFNPALLNGKDGFLDMTYDEVISACDLGVFPSWYEPWGYTPQESAAHAVPTVTSDLSGFGHWVRSLQRADSGVEIVSRRQTSYEDSAAALRDVLLGYANMSTEELDQRRRAVREVCDLCTWQKFFDYYVLAYEHAIDKAEERVPREYVEGVTKSRVLESSMSAAPNLRSFAVENRLPEPISRLRELAHNLWWCWHPESHMLFSELDPVEWEASSHNPVAVIEKASRATLQTLAADPAYLRRYESTMDAFDAYVNTPTPSFGDLSPERPAAYFSTEYGINESLPIYSGGLGVLSGDHMKSASDLNIPLVGVGLLYKSGYFIQSIDCDGRQVPHYPLNDFNLLPVERVLDSNGEQLEITIPLSGRRLYALVWLVRVGRIKLFLLDTDTPKNIDDDRIITARLYEADRDIRLRQEILLGMGGVRMLRKMGYRPGVYHMNEGHSAFLIFERLRILMNERGLNLAEATEVVRGSTIFTTHTPVDAGNECFNLDRMEVYFKSYAQTIGISWQDFVRIGRFVNRERNVFEMTVLALNYAFRSNGVSELHGHVSRQMWQDGWPGVPLAEIPIGHVTNGIHVPTYAGPAIRPRLEESMGRGWEEKLPDRQIWSRACDLPDDDIWSIRQSQKKRLLDYIRASLPNLCKTLNVPYEQQLEMAKRLTPDSLVIGFARRFAPYKRATLLLADAQRLARIVGRDDRPVIFVFAGKAHPADTMGIDIMQEVIRRSISPELRGKIFFIENYNIAISRMLVQGCDIWLNTPRRPHEASGTSGQKVPVNGGLNLSISDGWWCEGARLGNNGWTIGGEASPAYVPNQSDYDDAESLYTLLEEKVVPLFFERDSRGMPRGWLEMVRQSMQTLVAEYSSHRMVDDYVRDYYQPAVSRCLKLKEKNNALARRLAAWKADVSRRFGTLSMGSMTVDGLGVGNNPEAETLEVTVEVLPGDMQVGELLVQLVAGPGNGDTFVGKPDVVELSMTDEHDGKIVYSGSYVPHQNGRHMYGVRVMPVTDGLDSPLETRMVVWA